MGSLILWSEYACDALTLPETAEIGPHNRLVVGSIPTGPTKSKLISACLKGANVILPVGADCQCDRKSCFRSTTRLSRVIYSASE